MMTCDDGVFQEQTEPVDFSSSQAPNFAPPRGFEPPGGPGLPGVTGAPASFPRGSSPSGDSLARYRANGESVNVSPRPDILFCVSALLKCEMLHLARL